MAGHTLKIFHGPSGAIATVGTYDSKNYLIRLSAKGSDHILLLTSDEAEDVITILGRAVQVAKEANQKAVHP